MSISASINESIIRAIEALDEGQDEVTLEDKLQCLAGCLDRLYVERGNVGRHIFDCESKDGTRKAKKFSLAVDSWTKNEDGEWEQSAEPDWTYIDWWTFSDADTDWLVKGTPVTVIGFYETSTWVDDDGETQTRLFVNALRVIPSCTQAERKSLNEARKAKKAAPKSSSKKAGKISQLLGC